MFQAKTFTFLLALLIAAGCAEVDPRTETKDGYVELTLTDRNGDLVRADVHLRATNPLGATFDAIVDDAAYELTYWREDEANHGIIVSAIDDGQITVAQMIDDSFHLTFTTTEGSWQSGDALSAYQALARDGASTRIADALFAGVGTYFDVAAASATSEVAYCGAPCGAAIIVAIAGLYALYYENQGANCDGQSTSLILKAGCAATEEADCYSCNASYCDKCKGICPQQCVPE